MLGLDTYSKMLNVSSSAQASQYQTMAVWLFLYTILESYMGYQ